MADLSTAQLVELLGDTRAGIRSLEAVETLAVARLAAREEIFAEDGTVQEVSQGLGYRRMDAPDLVSEVFGLTAAQAGVKVDEAVVLATKTPSLVDAMGAGRIDAYRAGVIASELREAPRTACEEVLRRVDGSLGKPAGVLRQRTRRALEVVDKASLITKTKRARSELGLRMVPNDDSTDTWIAILPTEQSREAWAAVEPLAKQIRDTEGCSLDLARARAMTRLMLANCTGTFHVHFAVPADQAEDFAARFTGRVPDPTTPESGDEDPVVVTGMGASGTTIVPRGWVEEILDGDHGTVKADVVGCDPVTGGFVTEPIPIPNGTRPEGRRRPMPTLVTKSYRPTDACRAYVKARDQRCRFPGCTTSAYFTDLDHVRPWPLGPTDPRNLACLCRRHHRIKQRPGWTVRLNPDGTMDWTDPTGKTRTTHPIDHLGTSLPGGPATDAPAADFGDAIWAGDYDDPDAYIGGIPVDLALQRDIAERTRAGQPRRTGLRQGEQSPLETSLFELAHERIDWTNAAMGSPRPSRPIDTWWLAS